MRFLWNCLFSLVLTTPHPLSLSSPPTLSVPSEQRVRVNDTLVLVLSRPYCRYLTEAGAPATLWKRAELHGRRGYHHVLDNSPSFYPSLGVAASAREGMLRLLVWKWGDRQPTCAGSRLPKQLADNSFTYETWDVRYRVQTTLCNQDLEQIPRVFFSGYAMGKVWEDDPVSYHLLSYWLTREQARVARTHRLPPAGRFERYLALSRDTGDFGLLKSAYRPLLVRLLRAYQHCPMPAATARRLAQTRRVLVR